MKLYRTGYRLIQCQKCHKAEFRVWINTQEEAQANILLAPNYVCNNCAIMKVVDEV